MNGIEKYLLLGFGRKYIVDSFDLIETLRHFRDRRSIEIVVLPEDEYFAVNCGLFHKVHVFDPSTDEDFNLCSTSFEKFCLIPRLNLWKFIDGDKTMVLDTDILCAAPTDKVWNLLKNGQPVNMLGSRNNPRWHWGHWGRISEKLLIDPIETHGGLLFFNGEQEHLIKLFFKIARTAFENYDLFGMQRFYQHGAVDEPCFAYAFSKMRMSPIEFSKVAIMTFNLNENDEFPTKFMTEKEQAKVMDEYIPFVHMFCKNQHPVFKQVKENILKS